MITSGFDWEQRQQEDTVRQCIDSMVSPSIEDAIDVTERLK